MKFVGHWIVLDGLLVSRGCVFEPTVLPVVEPEEVVSSRVVWVRLERPVEVFEVARLRFQRVRDSIPGEHLGGFANFFPGLIQPLHRGFEVPVLNGAHRFGDLVQNYLATRLVLPARGAWTEIVAVWDQGHRQAVSAWLLGFSNSPLFSGAESREALIERT